MQKEQLKVRKVSRNQRQSVFPGDVLAVSPEMYRSPLDETSTGLMLFTILELLITDELG